MGPLRLNQASFIKTLLSQQSVILNGIGLKEMCLSLKCVCRCMQICMCKKNMHCKHEIKHHVHQPRTLLRQISMLMLQRWQCNVTKQYILYNVKGACFKAFTVWITTEYLRGAKTVGVLYCVIISTVSIACGMYCVPFHLRDCHLENVMLFLSSAFILLICLLQNT